MKPNPWHDLSPEQARRIRWHARMPRPIKPYTSSLARDVIGCAVAIGFFLLAYAIGAIL